MNPFLRALLAKRAELQARQDQIVTDAEARVEQERAAAAEGVEVREALTEDEEQRFAELSAEMRPMDERITELQDAEVRGAAAAEAARGVERAAHVRTEPTMYSRHAPEKSFFLDLARATLQGDHAARARLNRHREEVDVDIRALEADRRAGLNEWLGEFDENSGASVTRDLTGADGSGGDFIPPIWLLNEYAEMPRGARPFADAVRGIPLPGGTDSINIPRITTGTSVAMQTANNAAVAEQDMVTATVTAPVCTAAGQQDLPIQLLDQSPLAYDQIVFQDLYADLDAGIDLQTLNGSGAAGQVRGILNVVGVNAVTYTDASPTVPELHPKIAGAIATAGTARKRPPTLQAMSFSRWMWILSAVDSTGRPLVPPTAQAYNPLATASAIGPDGLVGGHLLTPVIADVNMPTTLGGGTEDRIIITKADDHILFEGQTRARVLQEVLSGTLQVRIQVYKYIAFTAGRFPSGTSVIAGTGLVTPTF